MTIPGNPKSLALDIADGFTSLTPTALKRYSPSEIRTIYQHLNLALREVRAEAVPAEDATQMRRKNLRIQRLNQALLLLSNYCRQQRIPL